jgi:hypothetical protein
MVYYMDGRATMNNNGSTKIPAPSSLPTKAKVEEQWATARRFIFAPDEIKLNVPTPKFIWTAALVLCDRSNFTEYQGIFGLNKQGYGNYTVFFAQGPHDRSPEPIPREIVETHIFPLLDPKAAALFMLLCSPACYSHDTVRIVGKDLLKLLRISNRRRWEQLRILAIKSRLINSLAVVIHEWPEERNSTKFNMFNFRLLNICVRVRAKAAPWIYLEGNALAEFDYSTMDELELLVTPGAWAKKFLSKTRRQYTAIPRELPAAIISLSKFRVRASRALVDLVFRVRVAKRCLFGREIAKVLSPYSDEVFEDLVDQSSQAFALANGFDRFLREANEFFSIRCQSPKFLPITSLEFSSDGRVEYKEEPERRPHGYWEKYLRAEFEVKSRLRDEDEKQEESPTFDESEELGNSPLPAEILGATKSLGLTLMEIAARTGIPQGTWSKAFGGKISLTPRLLDSLFENFPALLSLFPDFIRSK